MAFHQIDRMAVEDEGEGRRRRLRARPGRQLQHLHAADAGARAPPRCCAVDLPGSGRSQTCRRPAVDHSVSSRRCRRPVHGSASSAPTSSATRSAPSSASTSRWRRRRWCAACGAVRPADGTTRRRPRTAIRARAREGAQRGPGVRMQEITAALVQAALSADTPPAPAAGRGLRAREPDAARTAASLCPHLRGARRRPAGRGWRPSPARCCWSPATRTVWPRRRRCARWPSACTPPAPARVVVLPRCGHWTPGRTRRRRNARPSCCDFLAAQR